MRIKKKGTDGQSGCLSSPAGHCIIQQSLSLRWLHLVPFMDASNCGSEQCWERFCLWQDARDDIVDCWIDKRPLEESFLFVTTASSLTRLVGRPSIQCLPLLAKKV
jgi:hypothetical protein